MDDPIRREEIILCLKEITDLERLISRIVYGAAGGRDLVSLARGLEKLPTLRGQLEGCSSSLLDTLCGELDDLPQLLSLIHI